MTINYQKHLNDLRDFLASHKIDYLILPNTDKFFSEYLPIDEKRIEHLCGFTGSNATLIISKNRFIFFTDGRYTLQAARELKENLGSEKFEIINLANESILAWLNKNLNVAEVLGIDPALISLNQVKHYQHIANSKSAKITWITPNPIKTPTQNSPLSKIYFHELKYSGVDSLAKRKQIIAKINCDALLITKPESLCWLLNIRARDVEFAPLLLAYAILLKNGEVILFADQLRLDDRCKNNLKQVQIKGEDALYSLKSDIKTMGFDPDSTNYFLHNKLAEAEIELVPSPDPILELKASKNPAEIRGAIKAHELDGSAVTKFLFWLTTQKKLDEIEAENKLLEFRKQNKEFLYPSFASISAFKENAAVVHYHATLKTNKKFNSSSLYLIDSGGQYQLGTTDITRTVAIGKPTREMIKDFTSVLKGHIRLARAKFPFGTTGDKLDALARYDLWTQEKDYDHGTGHGVGSFLSVHESPPSISKRASSKLLPGMILSDEPGFYKSGKYGIRIESLMLVEKSKKDFMQFRTLTLAPIDPALIDPKLLDNEEKIWLYDYHHIIYIKLKKYLGTQEKKWLLELKQIYKQMKV